MTVFFGLLAATTLGAADYLGGALSRRAPSATVVFWSQLLGALLSGGLAAMVSAAPPELSLGISITAGLALAFTVLLFYHALAVGQMSLVAPISACGAVVPVVVSVLTGHVVGIFTWLGMSAALGGVLIVSVVGPMTQGGSASSSGLLRHLQVLGIHYAIVIAGGMGVYLTLTALAANASSGRPLWVVAISRATALLIIAPWTYRTVGALGAPWSLAKGVVALAVLDTVGNASYVLAAAAGNYGVAAVLASMYPIGTTVLAIRFLGERLGRSEGYGVALAIAGVGLVSMGR